MNQRRKYATLHLLCSRCDTRERSKKWNAHGVRYGWCDECIQAMKHTFRFKRSQACKGC